MAHIFKPKLWTLFKSGFTKDQIVSDIMAGTMAKKRFDTATSYAKEAIKAHETHS